MNHLKELKLNPLSLKKMTIKDKKYSDHCVYLVYFKNMDKMSIAKLRQEASIINYVKVRWDFYNKKRKGPIQCSKCMQYGHGGKNCYLKPKCIRCGESHSSIECPLLIDPATNARLTRIPDEKLKCALCGQQHAANYSRCEKRLEFMRRQEVYRNRIQRRPTNRVSHFHDAMQLKNFNFPPINNATGSAWSNPPPITTSDHTIQNESSTDLFSTDELLKIFQELMTSLGKATSKIQQITILGQIAIKYASK
jgi:hypothetical protein